MASEGFFEVHSSLAQYQSTNSPKLSLVDTDASFDTPRVPNGVQKSDEKNIFDFPGPLCSEL